MNILLKFNNIDYNIVDNYAVNNVTLSYSNTNTFYTAYSTPIQFNASDIDYRDTNISNFIDRLEERIINQNEIINVQQTIIEDLTQRINNLTSTVYDCQCRLTALEAKNNPEGNFY